MNANRTKTNLKTKTALTKKLKPDSKVEKNVKNKNFSKEIYKKIKQNFKDVSSEENHKLIKQPDLDRLDKWLNPVTVPSVDNLPKLIHDPEDEINASGVSYLQNQELENQTNQDQIDDLNNSDFNTNSVNDYETKDFDFDQNLENQQLANQNFANNQTPDLEFETQDQTSAEALNSELNNAVLNENQDNFDLENQQPKKQGFFKRLFGKFKKNKTKDLQQLEINEQENYLDSNLSEDYQTLDQNHGSDNQTAQQNFEQENWNSVESDLEALEKEKQAADHNFQEIEFNNEFDTSISQNFTQEDLNSLESTLKTLKKDKQTSHHKHQEVEPNSEFKNEKSFLEAKEELESLNDKLNEIKQEYDKALEKILSEENEQTKQMFFQNLEETKDVSTDLKKDKEEINVIFKPKNSQSESDLNRFDLELSKNEQPVLINQEYIEYLVQKEPLSANLVINPIEYFGAKEKAETNDLIFKQTKKSFLFDRLFKKKKAKILIKNPADTEQNQITPFQYEFVTKQTNLLKKAEELKHKKQLVKKVILHHNHILDLDKLIAANDYLSNKFMEISLNNLTNREEIADNFANLNSLIRKFYSNPENDRSEDYANLYNVILYLNKVLLKDDTQNYVDFESLFKFRPSNFEAIIKGETLSSKQLSENDFNFKKELIKLPEPKQKTESRDLNTSVENFFSNNIVDSIKNDDFEINLEETKDLSKLEEVNLEEVDLNLEEDDLNDSWKNVFVEEYFDVEDLNNLEGFSQDPLLFNEIFKEL